MLAWLSQPIRRDLWLARAYYFTFMGGWGFILPFINLYYVSLGLSGKQIGIFASTSAVVGLVAARFYALDFGTKRVDRSAQTPQPASFPANGAGGFRPGLFAH